MEKHRKIKEDINNKRFPVRVQVTLFTDHPSVELDFVDLPNYTKIKWLIGDCGFYINEIEGMYLNVIGRNLVSAQSNVL